MRSLYKDRELLTLGGVFTDDTIDAYIALIFDEIINLSMHLTQLSLRCIRAAKF
jgi:hypothetical protein